MRKTLRDSWAIGIAMVLSAVAMGSQQQSPPQQTMAQPAPMQTSKMEGKVTSALNTTDAAMPSFTLKTVEGKEYTVHLVTLKDTEGKVYTPTVGEQITVTGFACCQLAGKQVIHSVEVIAAGKTYRAPAGQPIGGMMMGPGLMMGQQPAGQAPVAPGQMGPGMMMGQGAVWQAPAPQVQVAPGTVLCPGMTGQVIPGAAVAQTPVAPGTISCCAGTVPAGTAFVTGCPGWQVQQPPAIPKEGTETK